jgi:hypothetical protein
MPREERRLPEGQDAFHRHDREGMLSRRNCSLRPSRRLSRSRRPHFFPKLGRVLLMGIARPRCGHPQVRDIRECGRLLDSLTVRAWD